MKLELKHLAPYLPYKLMCLTPKHRFKYGTQESLLMTGLSVNLDELVVEFLRDDDLEFSNTMMWVKPILRPMSDLNKEYINEHEVSFIDHIYSMSWMAGGYRLTESDLDVYIISEEDESKIYISKTKPKTNMWWITNELIKWHFDIFGLIDKNLAVDTNTLK